MFEERKNLFWQIFIITSLIVGISAKPRIKYGEITETRYPFLAFLFIGKIEETPEEISINGVDCAGSLLTVDWLVSAAHCFYGIRDDKDLVENQIIAYFGSNERPKLLEPTKSNGYSSKAIEFIIHEGYRQSSKKAIYDIALVRFENPIPSEFGTPIRLPRREITHELNGRTATIIGWGETERSKSSKQLREAQIKLSDFEYCQERDLICQVSEYNILTEGNARHTRPDTGHGDSGGPLLLRQNNNWLLIGVVSGEIVLSSNTGEEYDLGTYTDVSRYLAWISKYIS